MINLKQKLKLLYTQKNQIENEIDRLEKLLEEEKSLVKKRKFTKDEKIELFKSLFIARYDIYAKQWINKEQTKKVFYTVSKTFRGEDYLPLTNETVEQHLRGNIFLATYCIDHQNMSKFIAIELLDSDKFALNEALNSINIRAYYELNSYNTLVAWIFLEQSLSAKAVHNFAQYLIKKANISAKIYPSKEFSSKSSLDTSIELPLHLTHRKQNRTIFIDANTNKIYEDQWSVLSNVKKVSKDIVYNFSQNSQMLSIAKEFEDIIFPEEKLKMTLYDFIYIPTLKLSKSFLDRLKAFASFDNPQIKILLSLRKPLYNTPRVIKSFVEDEKYLQLPRGLLKTIQTFLNENGVSFEIEDKRVFQKVETKKVKFTLRVEQDEAIRAISKSDCSICVAPPGFGKTLIGAKMFELRECNTLIVVNKNMLLDQWIARFVDYFGYEKKDIGYLGKGKNKLNGKIDVATMQSLKNSSEVVDNYSFVIVDECHHIPAVTFEQIIKNFKGKYILGLSATPNRKDGLDPILYQQLGKISYEYKKKKTHYNKLKIIRTNFSSNADNYATIINELCVDSKRNSQIVESIKEYRHRKILLLTDRIEHINILEKLLEEERIDFISIHGSMNKKEQVENMQKVAKKSLILATTSYFGEGIDFPHLNTILFATPISYYGRLIQYLGRIGRGNQECLAIDFLDSRNAMLNSAYKKRLEGYKQMHYK